MPVFLLRSRLKWVGLGLLVFVVNTVALYAVFTSRGQFIIWDIHPTLVAGQAVWQGQDPYSAEVTATIQRQVYGGRLARPTEDTMIFAYPPYVAYLAIPLALLPRAWAQAAWLSLLEAAIVAGTSMSSATWGWPRSRLASGVMFAFCLFFYPVVWGFILGQITLILFVLLALAVWAASQRRDGLAGVALGLTIVKPQLVCLIAPGMVIWAVARRRWRLVAGAFVVVALLIAASWSLQPQWIASVLKRLAKGDPYQGFAAPTQVVLDRCCASVSGWLEPLLACAVLGAVVYSWWVAARRGREADFLWAVGVTLIATTAILPQVSIVSQVILLLPILGAVKLLVSQGRWGRLVAIGVLILWGAGLWLLSWLPPVLTAQPRYPVEHRVLSPVLPFTLGLIWLIGRSALVRDRGGQP